MNVFKWLVDMPGIIRGAIIIITLGIDCLIYKVISRHIEKFYDRTNSAEKAMSRLRIMNQYLGGVVMVISCIVIALTSTPFFRRFGNIGKVLGTFTYFALIILMLLMTQIVYFKLIQRIRDTTETASEQLINTLRILIFSFIPMILIIAVFSLIPSDVQERIFSSSFGMVLLLLFLMSIQIVMSLLHKTILKAVPMEE